jgi:two-component system, LytTR family, response regulator
MIRAVLVDDEPLARAIVREYLAAHPSVELVAECENGFEAVRAVTAHDPDVLFLDIQMPKLDGFEVLELLDRKPLVVFVTAHDEFAIKAFEAHALDYLLKPFSRDRFDAVIARIEQNVARRAGQPLERVASAARKGPLQRIVVRDGSSIDVLLVSKLDYAEAADDYVVLVSGEKRLRKQQTIAQLEAELDSSRFVRIHRSYIVNVDRLEKIEPYAKESRVAILRDGRRLPVSRSGYTRLKELL